MSDELERLRAAVRESVEHVEDLSYRNAEDVLRLLAAFDAQAVRIKELEGEADDHYERGYADGESSGRADFAFALEDVLPEDVDGFSLTEVAAFVRSQAVRLQEVTRALRELVGEDGPFYADEYETMCFWCGVVRHERRERIPGEFDGYRARTRRVDATEHADDCAYVAARAVLAGSPHPETQP